MSEIITIAKAAHRAEPRFWRCTGRD